MRAPLEVGWRPSPASMTPALAISSLNLPISAKSSLGGSTPASEFLSALTSSMNRICLSPRGPGLCVAPLHIRRTREAGSTEPVCLLERPGASSCRKWPPPLDQRMKCEDREGNIDPGNDEKGLPD